MNNRIWLIFLILLTSNAQAGDYNVGVYYYPGWKDYAPGVPKGLPWEAIKKFPEREPLLGWYKEGEADVVEQQISWMSKHSINYIVYDWYWSESGSAFLEHGVQSFLKAQNNSDLKFAFLWANHDKAPNSLSNFTKMIRYLCRHYFHQANYYQIDGKPVLFIYSQQKLLDKAKAFGKTQRDLLNIAREIAKEEGFKSLYIIGGAEAVNYWVKDEGPKAGYDAFSAYNYHRGFSGIYIPEKPKSHSFKELDAAYEESWTWIVKNSPIPYIVPAISGWDKRPWGGSPDPLHDNSVSTPEEFKKHLMNAKALIDANPEKTNRSVVICCWNEYGEGSIIEPTKKYKFKYLEAISEVFK